MKIFVRLPLSFLSLALLLCPLSAQDAPPGTSAPSAPGATFDATGGGTVNSPAPQPGSPDGTANQNLGPNTAPRTSFGRSGADVQPAPAQEPPPVPDTDFETNGGVGGGGLGADELGTGSATELESTLPFEEGEATREPERDRILLEDQEGL